MSKSYLLRKLALLFCVFLCGYCLQGTAQIVTDGSLGPQLSLIGPKFSVQQALGQQRGANLFHSFSEFNLRAGESVVFESDLSIGNIIARVSGSNLSLLDGEITATPNLFLMNPNGIVINSNFELNVGGSFHVTTADYLGFNNSASERFYADLGQTSTLSVAPVSAFGFLEGEIGSIDVNNANVSLNQGQTLSIVGGPINIDASSFEVQSGLTQIAAAGSSGEAGLGNQSEINSTNYSSSANVNIDNSSFNSLAIEAGDVVISGGAIFITQSQIHAQTSLSNQEREIRLTGDYISLNSAEIISESNDTGIATSVNLSAVDLINIDKSIIKSIANGDNSGANISIEANQIRLNITSTPDIDPFSSLSDSLLTQIETVTTGVGTGGYIHIQANDLNTGDVFLATTTSGIQSNAGDSGDIQIVADATTVNSRDSFLIGNQLISETISTRTFGSGNSGDIDIQTKNLDLISGTVSTSSGSFNAPNATGNTGLVNVTSEVITIRNGGFVTRTTGFGAGGNISIKANSIEFTDNPGSILSIIGSSRIVSQTSSTAGNGGSIYIDADELVLNSDSFFDATTMGSGSSGSINIDTELLSVKDNSFISSRAIEGAGSAGDINIDADNLEINGDSYISNLSVNLGNAGDINISSGSTSIKSNAYLEVVSKGPGSVGNINLDSDYFELRDGGKIFTNSLSGGQSGAIIIAADNALLSGDVLISTFSNAGADAGDIYLFVNDKLEIFDNSKVSTEARFAGGGNITLNANTSIWIRDSLVTTSVITSANASNGGIDGDGGNISIDPILVVLDNSRLVARAVGGNGGNIDIVTNFLLGSSTSIIDASSQFGLSGQVEISTINVELKSDIALAPPEFLDAAQWVNEPCNLREGSNVSNFVVAGRDGAYTSPHDLAVGSYFNLPKTQNLDVGVVHLHQKDDTNKQLDRLFDSIKGRYSDNTICRFLNG